MSRDIVIGIDGGGTHTRALAVDLHGHVLAYVETNGANPDHNQNAKDNVQEAIRSVVVEAGCTLRDVRCLVAGFAGFDSVEDAKWAESFTDIPGITCPRYHVNDAVIAHSGALASKPGIVAIAGTGSIIYGINEADRHIRNYDFRHYAATAARHISYEAVYQVIAGQTKSKDEPLVQTIYHHFGVKFLRELSALGSKGFLHDLKECNRLFGQLAPAITEAALQGIPLAVQVCDRAVQEVVTGIRLVSSCFEERTILVALEGSVLKSHYMKEAVKREMIDSTKNSSDEQIFTFQLVEPFLSSVGGAVLLAFQHLGIPAHHDIYENILTNLKGKPVPRI